MPQRFGEASESDSPELLFGDPGDDPSYEYAGDDPGGDAGAGAGAHHRRGGTRASRSSRRRAHGGDGGEEGQARHGRRRRNRRIVGSMALILVAVVAVATWLVVLPVYRYLSPSDYSGNGTGKVLVEVEANDGAGDIGTTLQKHGVIASARAFSDAADGNTDSQNIQPGTYRLHSHMSAAAALALLLTPSSRVNRDVLVPEGATSLEVARRLVAKPCTGTPSADTICGPGMSRSAVAAALKNIKSLGLPTDYRVGSGPPDSVEGFLYPATYYFAERTDASVALQQMIAKFTEQARATNFTTRAKALGISPYQELIIASIAQSEAKFPGDYAKVARVILNRLAAKTPLKVDATSIYGAELKGLNPNKIINSEIDSPYNTYRIDGLPPTPISNPGADAMNGAAHPAEGNWTYYVNGDKAGHLFFTNSAAAFTIAQRKCHNEGWGCAAP